MDEIAVGIKDDSHFADIVRDWLSGHKCQGDFDCDFFVSVVIINDQGFLEFYCKDHGSDYPEAKPSVPVPEEPDQPIRGTAWYLVNPHPFVKCDYHVNCDVCNFCEMPESYNMHYNQSG